MSHLELKQRNRELSLQEIADGATRLQSRPIRFWFDLYGECSLKCKHCTYRTDGRTSDQEVSESVYGKVMDEIMPTAYICNLGGTNFGEMTISKMFPRFLEDCLKHDVRISLTTNGTRMADQWLDQLVACSETVGFSMDGMEDVYEHIRGYRWKHFIANVKKLADARDKANADFNIEWRFCVHSDSVVQLPDIIRAADAVGVDVIRVMNLIAYVPSQKFKQLQYHRSLANHWFSEARKVADQCKVHVDIPDDFRTGEWGDYGNEKKQTAVALTLPNGEQLGTSDPVKDAIQMSACYMPWQACSINELGDVRPCCTYWRAMGQIRTRSFEQVWNGAKYRWLRRDVNEGQSNSICHACRQPKFDSDANAAAYQDRASFREVAKQVLETLRAPKRKAIEYDHVQPIKGDYAQADATPAEESTELRHAA